MDVDFRWIVGLILFLATAWTVESQKSLSPNNLNDGVKYYYKNNENEKITISEKELAALKAQLSELRLKTGQTSTKTRTTTTSSIDKLAGAPVPIDDTCQEGNKCKEPECQKNDSDCTQDVISRNSILVDAKGPEAIPSLCLNGNDECEGTCDDGPRCSPGVKSQSEKTLSSNDESNETPKQAGGNLPELKGREKIVSSIVSGSNRFAAKLYSEVSDRNLKSNFIISPLSLNLVLAMTLAGASGRTFKQIVSVLGLPKLKDEILEGFQVIGQDLKGNSNFSLNIANNIFVDDGFILKSKFLSDVSTRFNVNPASVQFANEKETLRNINLWVSETTSGKIVDLIQPGSLDGNTKMVLINAIYFKGVWKTAFDPANTRKRPFYVTTNQSVNCEMMRATGNFLHAEVPKLNAHAFRLKYSGDRIVMTILLPDARDGLQFLEENLGELSLSSLNFVEEKVDLSMPKFKSSLKMDFAGVLKDLGMKFLFDSAKAELSDMSDEEGLFVSKISCEAVIEVNEEGTEAAAATAAVVQLRTISLSPSFTCDHPFLYVITDVKTGIDLFVGRVLNPLQK